MRQGTPHRLSTGYLHNRTAMLPRNDSSVLFAAVVGMALMAVACGPYTIEDRGRPIATQQATNDEGCWQEEISDYAGGATLGLPDDAAAIAAAAADAQRQAERYAGRDTGFYPGYDADVYRAKAAAYQEITRTSLDANTGKAIWTAVRDGQPIAETILERRPSDAGQGGWVVAVERWRLPDDVCRRLASRPPVPTTAVPPAE